MILTTYFDESGTHAGSPVTIMAGILGTANQWRTFQKKLDELKARYGFGVFHSKHFKARSGEFRGWHPTKCLNLSYEFVELCARGFIRGTVFILRNEDYRREYVGENTPRRLRLDTEYGLAFRYCLTDLALEGVRQFGTHKRFPELRLRAVLEQGHRHSGDALRIFAEMQRELGTPLLDSITFADKGVDPLMAADFLAHTTFMMEANGTTQNPPPEMPRRHRETTSLIHSGFEPGALAVLKASLIEELRAKSGRASGGRAASSSGQPS